MVHPKGHPRAVCRALPEVFAIVLDRHRESHNQHEGATSPCSGGSSELGDSRFIMSLPKSHHSMFWAPTTLLLGL